MSGNQSIYIQKCAAFQPLSLDSSSVRGDCDPTLPLPSLRTPASPQKNIADIGVLPWSALGFSVIGLRFRVTVRVIRVMALIIGVRDKVRS